MRGLLIVVAMGVAIALGACSAAPAATPASTATSGPKSLPPSASASADPAYPALSKSPSVASAGAPSAGAASYKAGDWPPEWQKWICMARAELLREDAAQGGMPGLDAATQAIAYLRNAPNWEPGSDLRALIGKAGFVMADAAPRGGAFLKDIADANAAFEVAYEELRASTGFECPS